MSNGLEAQHNSWDGSYFATTRVAAKSAYEEAGIDKPREEISLIEVHDCFSITELVTMEDLHISPEGGAIKDVLDGFYDADGKMPCQIDGGLKCFGHPIGASGLRMIYEMYLQLQGRAGARQRKTAAAPRPDAQSRRLPAPERLLDLDRREVRGVVDRHSRAKRRNPSHRPLDGWTASLTSYTVATSATAALRANAPAT